MLSLCFRLSCPSCYPHRIKWQEKGVSNERNWHVNQVQGPAKSFLWLTMGYPLPICTNTSIYTMINTTHGTPIIMACDRTTTGTQQRNQGEHHYKISHTSGAMRPNVAHQPPRATGIRYETERSSRGWLHVLVRHALLSKRI